MPLTVSLTLLALSGIIDRFVVAHLAGVAQAGKYVASADLANQALIIPAISVASAFVPIAVQTLAQKGAQAASRATRGKHRDFVHRDAAGLSGLRVVSHHIGDLVLGAEFRGIAGRFMPIVAIAILFQILTQQYLHISFLMSNRNSFYLGHTGSMIVFNVSHPTCWSSISVPSAAPGAASRPQFSGF